MILQDQRNIISGWFFPPEELGEALVQERMLCPSIDLTNACNLNCSYCFIEEKDSTRKLRKPNELSQDEVVAVIDDFRESGARTVNIVGAGEPTIDPHFEETIDHIARHNLTAVLFTNGIRLSEEPSLINFLYSRNVSVVLKYNSQSGALQDLAAGRNGYSAKRDHALTLLQDVGFNKSLPTRLGLDIITFSGNLREIPSIHRSCRQKNIFPIAGEYIPTGRTDEGHFQGYGAMKGLTEPDRQRLVRILQPLTADERSWLLSELQETDQVLQIRPADHMAYFGGGVCTQILGVYVDVEGNIWPCVARKKTEGNALSNGLLGNTRHGDLPSQLWRQHPYMRAIRQGFNGGCPYKPAIVQLTDPPYSSAQRLGNPHAA